MSMINHLIVQNNANCGPSYTVRRDSLTTLGELSIAAIDSYIPMDMVEDLPNNLSHSEICSLASKTVDNVLYALASI